MHRGKQRTATLVVLIVAFPAVLILFYSGMNAGPDVPDAAISPADAEGGVVTDFVLKVPGSPATVHFPWGMITHDGEGFTALRNLTFTDRLLEFSALVSPWLNYTHLFVEGSGWNHTLNISISPSDEPLISGQAFYDTLAELVGNYPSRQTGTRGHYGAANWLYASFGALGYQAEIFHYRWSERAVEAGLANPIVPRPLSDILVVCGWHPGETSDEWIVTGAHFDNAIGNGMEGEGAYDDGSGTALMLELARTLAGHRTNRTHVFCGWGGEEEGLIGSERFAQNEIPDGTRVVFNLNLDMVGISYPNPFPLHQDIGPDIDPAVIDHPWLWEIVDNVTHQGMGWAKNGSLLPIRESTGGGSDHTSFQNIGTPTVFNIGEYDYPYYHTESDTLANMESFSGGRDKLIWTFDANAWLCLMELLYVDNTDLA